MPLTEEQAAEIKEELDNCKNPLYFFHDDPDGLCSFLLFYRYKKEGYGVVVKRSTPQVDEQFIPKVNEYSPDKIFIMDIAVVDQKFIDEVKVPVVWIDHHEPLKLDNVKIFNPRLNNKKDNTPVTYLCHQVVKQDLWIATVGCIGDWFYPDFMDEFKEKYPDLIKIDSKDPGDVLYNTKLGRLTRIFSFVLKGRTGNVKKCFKVLTRIDDPYDIIEQKTPAGKFIHKKFSIINKGYKELIDEAKKHVKEDNILLFVYSENKMSFSGDIANELMYKYPDKVVIVGREKEDEIKMSLRYHKKPLLPILKKALAGLDGYGGGHEYACGANIKTHQFKQFIENIGKYL